MNYHKAVVKLFNHYYNKIYRGANYQLDLETNNQHKVVDSFVKLMSQQFGLQSVGINTLLSFFNYSFHYWSTKKTVRRISLNWIIGKKTFKRFLEKKEGENYYIDKWLLENDVDVDSLKQQLHELENKELTSQGLDPAEELEKLRFEGEAKLYNCLQHTTLYHHRSVNCLTCMNRVACKRLLKNISPQLYKRRGYIKDESI